MNDGRFADFDAQFAQRAPASDERAPKAITIRLFGRRWPLGYDGSPPAAAVLRLARLAADGDLTDVDLTDPHVAGEVTLLAADLIPEKVLGAWLAKGIDVDQLGEICLWVFGQYQFGSTGGGDGEGEATAPEMGASASSSSDGASSSPTSTGSTPSSSTPPGPSTG